MPRLPRMRKRKKKKAKADADGGEMLDKILKCLDAMNSRMDAHGCGKI
jgi:hypothetical protein